MYISRLSISSVSAFLINFFTRVAPRKCYVANWKPPFEMFFCLIWPAKGYKPPKR